MKTIFDHGAVNPKFYLFSDGQEHELQNLLLLPQVEIVFFGNAILDMIALSKCKFIVGSDSTFTGWAAYLGQVPTVSPRKNTGNVLINSSYEFIDDGNLYNFNKFLHKYH